MSSRTQDTHATSPDIGFGHDEDVVKESFPRGTVGSLDHRATPVAVGASAEAYAGLVHEVKCLRETVTQIQNTLEAIQACLSTGSLTDQACLWALEHNQTRVEAQLDIVVRMQRPVAMPTVSAQVPSSQGRIDPDTA